MFGGVGLPGWEQEKFGGGGHFTPSTDHGVGWGEIKPPVERRGSAAWIDDGEVVMLILMIMTIR